MYLLHWANGSQQCIRTDVAGTVLPDNRNNGICTGLLVGIILLMIPVIWSPWSTSTSCTASNGRVVCGARMRDPSKRQVAREPDVSPGYDSSPTSLGYNDDSDPEHWPASRWEHEFEKQRLEEERLGGSP